MYLLHLSFSTVLLYLYTYQLFSNFKTSVVDTKSKAKCRVQNPLCLVITHITMLVRCSTVPPQSLILTIPPPHHHIEVYQRRPCQLTNQGKISFTHLHSETLRYRLVGSYTLLSLKVSSSSILVPAVTLS